MTPRSAFLSGLALLLIGLACLAGSDLSHFKAPLITAARAQAARCQGSAGPDTSMVHNAAGCPSGGGGSLTWTPTGANNDAGTCIFVTSCTVAVSVNPGLLIVSVLMVQAAGTGDNISQVTACTSSPVTLTAAGIVAEANANSVGLFYGVVICSGSQNIVVTSAVAGSITGIVAAAGTLTNYVSSTPGTGCSGVFNSNGSTTYACGSTITIASSGVGICAGGDSGSGGTLAFQSPLTNPYDEGSAESNGTGAISHSSTAGTITPEYTDSAFLNGGITCSPWH